MIPIIRRLGWSVAVLAGVSLLTFCLALLVPSDPARTIAGPTADAETLAPIRRPMGLEWPVLVQYAAYLGRLLQGDLGRSYLTRQDVSAAIGERLAATAILAAASLTLATVVGVLLACWSALRQRSRADVAVLVGS